MNSMQEFRHGLWTVRVRNTENGPVFVAADVCNVLGLGNPTMAMSRLDEDERTLISIEGLSRGNDMANAVTESGLYALVLGSRKPEAKAFKRWITHDVLPAIRKYGVYATPNAIDAMLADPDTMIRTLQALRDERAARMAAQNQLAIAAPKAEFFDAVANTEDTISVQYAAKLLNAGMGQNRLFDWMRDNELIMDDNTPYQRYIDAGYFRVVERKGWVDGQGVRHPTTQTRITQRGLAYLQKRLAGSKPC